MIKIKRTYEDPGPDDGLRYLVDRIWPRGVKKSTLILEAWLKNLAPSDSLRHWFEHDPAKWEEFKRRYFAELESKSKIWKNLLPLAQKGTVTLLYGTEETEHNNAVALKEYLETYLEGSL